MAGLPRVFAPWLFEEDCTSSTNGKGNTVGTPIPIVGGKSLDVLIHVLSATSTGIVLPASAAIAGRPDRASGSLTAYAGTGTATDARYPYDISALTTTSQLQLGVLAKLNSGSNPGKVKGLLTGLLYTNGMPIGERDILVPEGLGSTAARRLHGRVPSVGASKIRGGMWGMVPANVLDWQVYVRGILDPEVPGPWVAQGSLTQITSGSPDLCLGDITISGITLTDYVWLEVALGLSVHSGQSGPYGNLKSWLGVEYASGASSPTRARWSSGSIPGPWLRSR